ncbi:MAG: 2-C-methyl-D-erythritol 4-phosphate cytidylyltransferase [Bacteroidetes bacterium]|nr:2-C-methyl-D-erythritol 4-phosphate cytidylyltransferase [Bacteroidota bacterium]
MAGTAYKKFAIIVAGGSGKRMGKDVPKQFLLLNGKPVLAYCLEKFHEADNETEILVALHQDYFQLWEELCRDHNITIPHSLVEGGEERFHSVKNALDKIDSETGVVAIHDAARPFVSLDLISTSFNLATKHCGIIPVIPVSQSMRQRENKTWKVVDRNDFVLVQTPQVFDVGLLKEAYHKPYSSAFTDDATVFEASGFCVELMPGETQNIKITTVDDLMFGEFLLKQG